MNNYIFSKKYNKSDIAFSLIYYIYIFLITIIYFNIVKSNLLILSNIPLLKLLINFLLVILQLYPIFIFLAYKKQSLSTIGININRFFLSIFKGIFYFIPILVIRFIFLNYIFKDIIFDFNFIIYSFIQLIQIALVEEIIFRGFLQSIFSGFMKNKFLSIIIVAILFAFIHIGRNLVFDFYKFNIILFLLGFLKLFIKHIYYTYISLKTNSIFASTITHFLNNILSI